ncbi:MAG: hypothetical protein JNK85_27105 [Verrucomicrobiales bacterium]|nr:hypothetical protein [Verrucomicrobiales bacterium]
MSNTLLEGADTPPPCLNQVVWSYLREVITRGPTRLLEVSAYARDLVRASGGGEASRLDETTHALTSRLRSLQARLARAEESLAQVQPSLVFPEARTLLPSGLGLVIFIALTLGLLALCAAEMSYAATGILWSTQSVLLAALMLGPMLAPPLIELGTIPGSREQRRLRFWAAIILPLWIMVLLAIDPLEWLHLDSQPEPSLITGNGGSGHLSSLRATPLAMLTVYPATIAIIGWLRRHCQRVSRVVVNPEFAYLDRHVRNLRDEEAACTERVDRLLAEQCKLIALENVVATEATWTVACGRPLSALLEKIDGLASQSGRGNGHAKFNTPNRGRAQ